MINMWSKKRIERRKKMMEKLAYLRWYEEHYEETVDYALDMLFKWWND